MLEAILFYIPFFILFQAGLWKLFDKAGEQGWKSIVPIYNIIVWLKIIKKPMWLVLLLLIPFVNIYVYSTLITDLLTSFNKTKFYQHFLGVVFAPFYLSYLGFNKKAHYDGTFNFKRSFFRELIDPICWIVILAIIIKWFLFETFTIPTPSMEGTLLVGDVIVVSKIQYGARTPETPLQVPLTHQTIPWLNNDKSYSDWINLPSFRLPGISKVSRNDVVVFNWPADYLHQPVDLKTYYIKRCVGIPGDTLTIRNSRIYIDGIISDSISTIQNIYNVYTNRPINKESLESTEINNYHQFDRRLNYIEESKLGYEIEMSAASAEKLIKKNIADSVQIDIQAYDNQGSLWIPKKGITIFLNMENISRYGRTILSFEGLKNSEIKNKKLYIEGKQIESYTFQNDYYFMAGDNRHNSVDSRFWGFVPESYIVGKAWFVWFSIHKESHKGFWESIRWAKLFTRIN